MGEDMMDDYFSIREQLKDMQRELMGKLEHILDENDIPKDSSWFNFNNDRFVIIWTNGKLPMSVLVKFEETFGDIDYIYSTRLSDNLNIVFKRDNQ
jgi:hypothetical protein